MAQRSQYRRKRHLVPAGVDWQARIDAYYERRAKWVEAMRNLDPDYWIYPVAEVLARLGLEPGEWGELIGDLPAAPMTSPLVLLDAVRESAELRPEGGYDKRSTLAWKAACLKSASLVWAGAIELDQVKEAVPAAHAGVVEKLLTYSDLDAFWRRSGPASMTKADICAAWENESEFMDAERLKMALRRRKG